MSEEGGDGDNWGGEFGETKAEADGGGMGEGLERASATMFSGPGTWTTELVNSTR